MVFWVITTSASAECDNPQTLTLADAAARLLALPVVRLDDEPGSSPSTAS
jgi:hypothetical protein